MYLSTLLSSHLSIYPCSFRVFNHFKTGLYHSVFQLTPLDQEKWLKKLIVTDILMFYLLRTWKPFSFSWSVVFGRTLTLGSFDQLEKWNLWKACLIPTLLCSWQSPYFFLAFPWQLPGWIWHITLQHLAGNPYCRSKNSPLLAAPPSLPVDRSLPLLAGGRNPQQLQGFLRCSPAQLKRREGKKRVKFAYISSIPDRGLLMRFLTHCYLWTEIMKKTQAAA